jgi:proton glutamate symport protein
MLAGLGLLLLGALFPVHIGHHQGFAGLRWCGLTMFAWYSMRRQSLTVWIMFAILIGAELGVDDPTFAVGLRVVSDIFLRLIKTIIAPLILGTLITGIAGHGTLRVVGRLALKSLLYFEVVSTLALFIGLLAINITQAGARFAMPLNIASDATAMPGVVRWSDFLLNVFPENLAKSVAEGQVLQVVIFAVVFGLAVAQVRAETRTRILRAAESLSEAMFKFTNLVMYFAPFGVGAAMAYTVGGAGLGAVLSLLKLLGTFYAAMLAFGVLVLLPVALLAGVPVRRFLSAVAEPAAIAFGSSSSEAALPSAMEAMQDLGVPQHITAFVVPAGYSFNLDGSALYLALASVFVSQAAGIHMPWRQQLMMMLALMLASKGIAGVPRATLVVLLAMAPAFHLPLEPIFVLLGIDVLMDMLRTTINVVGNCLAAVVVARWEGEFADNLSQPGPSSAAPSH